MKLSFRAQIYFVLICRVLFVIYLIWLSYYLYQRLTATIDNELTIRGTSAGYKPSWTAMACLAGAVLAGVESIAVSAITALLIIRKGRLAIVWASIADALFIPFGTLSAAATTYLLTRPEAREWFREPPPMDAIQPE